MPEEGVKACGWWGARRKLSSLYEIARAEAQASFGDPTLLIEKYLVQPRHIELQVLGDLEGKLDSPG